MLIKKLSFGPIICFYTSGLILLAATGREIFDYLTSSLGAEFLVIGLWILFLGLAFVFLKSWKSWSISSRSWTALVLGLGILYAASFEVNQERLHLVQCGLLGWLFVRDNKKLDWKSLLIASTGLGLGIGVLDETVQSFTPGRYADIRDVIFSVLGSIWGAGIGVVGRGQGIRSPE